MATTITAALAGLGTKTHIAIGAGTYNEKLSIGKSVTLIGDGAVTIGQGAGPNIEVTAGAVALQNVTIDTAIGSGLAGVGVRCNGSGSEKLTIVESTISSNQGVGVLSSFCDVVLRRNTIRTNTGGGVSLANGTFVVVNDVIFGNGGTAASVGGLNLGTPSVGTLAAYNTITGNIAQTGGTSGILCGGPMTLTNNIVWGNVIVGGGGQEQLGCTFTNSNVPNGSGTNISADPLFVDTTMDNYSLKTTPTLSPCINTGTTAPTGGTVLDIKNNTRPMGTATDMGAYEVQ
ncbi:MAG: hypothetical protein KC503_16720 [Myxococcales bacterium]|nr:hypothetical protein [Myxococcales bacterium]